MVKDLPPLKDIIETHELRAKKSLGQNFLLDLNVTNKIANHVKTPHDTTFFEIGPGPGGLTRSLLMTDAKKVIAVEFDPRAINALQSLKEASNGRLDIHHADALSTDLKDFCSDEPAAIVANLPYNIATPLLLRWLEQIHTNQNAYSHMILMFQKEVADRIVAKPNTKAYGRLSVMSQWLCDCVPLFDLPPSVFSPPPKITSTVVRFIPKHHDTAPSFESMEMVVKAAFSQRRKMIRSTLKPYLSVLHNLGIKETLRAEDLSVDNFIAIAKNIK